VDDGLALLGELERLDQRLLLSAEVLDLLVPCGLADLVRHGLRPGLERNTFRGVRSLSARPVSAEARPASRAEKSAVPRILGEGLIHLAVDAFFSLLTAHLATSRSWRSLSWSRITSSSRSSVSTPSRRRRSCSVSGVLPSRSSSLASSSSPGT